ncbi:MAG TPA: alpha/beta hydrolase [Noviherbaspirillum sp.]|jgi:putative phosphoribosyl transferase|uniref:dienelactone hydrolase family protein n=1 Tax=Noviherbaspirillum sp. TaxID=1926288 RepID=UPI002DDCF69B|nr:alpha/beta hydrolase [Noviherbaspirillum sp.]HEV2609363.1 alpha/beta hydrolase [Noviherbaspirillum sp.]
MTSPAHGEHVSILAGPAELDGTLWLPDDYIGVIMFAPGDGYRLKPQNDYVACILRNARLGIFWFDPLTASEASSGEARGDPLLQSARLGAGYDWLRRNIATRDLPIGLYGADHSATAALQFAAECDGIAAIVARGAHAEPASPASMTRINAPTLLIAGGLDDPAIRVGRTLYAALRCRKRLEIVPGATCSFEEPGNLDVVARLARGWFMRHTHSRTRFSSGLSLWGGM